MRARAPASAANLGPGFDVLAVALDRYVEVEVRPADRLSVRNEGAGWSPGAADHADHLAARVAVSVVGHDRLDITVRSDVPVGRGLGSSAALAVAAAAAAGSPDPLAVGARVDGHADNAAASVTGGLVAAVPTAGGIRVARFPLDPELRFVAAVPERQLPTAQARQVLPANVGREDATFNLSHMALLLAGLADHRRLTTEATADRLHQDYRSALFPEAPSILAAMEEAGASAACWSGAGPTLLALCVDQTAGAVAEATGVAMARADVAGEVLRLRPDLDGLLTWGADGSRHAGPAVAPADPGLHSRR